MKVLIKDQNQEKRKLMYKLLYIRNLLIIIRKKKIKEKIK